ncbi:MAG: copper-binding protein [Propionivibrio sp.]
MKQTISLLAASAIAMSSSFAVPALAQTAPDQGQMEMAGTTSMTDGEVRKVDKAAGKLTIKHGDIKHLDMPGMTMVFVAKDKSMLDKVKAGDKVSFMVAKENGKLTVTAIEPAQ